MSKFLRVIRQGKWHRYPEVDWLEIGDLKGDALSDIQTQDGKLSVYLVDSEVDRRRVVVALAATRENVSNIDYAVFENARLVLLGIMVDQSPGKMPDQTVNGMHYELGRLTTKRLTQLADVVSAGEHKRILKKRIKELLKEAIDAGRLDRTLIEHPRLQSL